MNEPITWFHGLIAERTTAFSSDAIQAPFLRCEIERFGQPALDPGCGDLRLLLHLLGTGLNIDGCDLSADMLEHCRNQAEAQELSPRLFQQPMHALDLSRKYRTIFLCASSNLAGNQRHGLQTLRRCFAHLEAGGALILDIDAEYTCHKDWETWSLVAKEALPEPWPTTERRQATEDGTEYVERQRALSVDPLEQQMVQQIRIEKWASGKRVARQEYEQRRTLYMPNEILLMLQIAGFGDITIRGDYTDQPATSDNEVVVFTARKLPTYQST